MLNVKELNLFLFFNVFVIFFVNLIFTFNPLTNNDYFDQNRGFVHKLSAVSFLN